MSVKLKYGLIFLIGWGVGVVGVLVSWRVYAEQFVHGRQLELVRKINEDSQFESTYMLATHFVNVLRANREGTLDETNRSLCSLIMIFISHLESEKRSTQSISVEDINKAIDEGKFVISSTGVCVHRSQQQ